MLHYTATDQSMIAQADLFAATKHAGQARKDGTPYIHHPRYVSVLAGYWAQNYFYEPAQPDQHMFSRLGIIRVTGLCHDLIEDQDVHRSTLHVMFGPQVAEFVSQLSNDKNIKDWEARNLAYCEQLMAADIDTQLIKLADLYHNAVSATPNSKFGIKWAKKARSMLNSLNKIPMSCSFYRQTCDALNVREEVSTEIVA
jgi:GTP pyrophosphokinase